ncbi:ribonuclease H-like domain-containing protein [Tanacetum coccineum]
MSSMGELTFFLGLQVKQKPDGIFISQDKYVAEILKKFDFANVKTASTPIETQKPLVKDEEANDVDVHLYRSMIGSLMYLTASRPDIMFAVCACSRFQVTPKSSHLSVVKRIFRYLKGKPKLGLWYPRVSSFDLESYSDSDYAGANLDRKSTTGGCQFLGRRLISWQCKKQTIVATSTIEAAYVATVSYCGQNPVYHSKTKHIAIRHHFIRDAYEKKLIQVLKIHTDDNVADLLTKAFDVSRWDRCYRLEFQAEDASQICSNGLYILRFIKFISVRIDSAKDKTSLGYDGQMNESELNNIHMNKSKVVHSVFNSKESDVDDNPVTDRFKIGEGFHAVPPPYTRNYMPSRPDLSFARLDESVFKSTVRKTTTSVPETDTSISKTIKDIVEKPKTVRPRQIPINIAKQSPPKAAASISTAKPVNTAAPKPKVNDALPTTYSYFLAHSPVKKPINKRTTITNINFNKKINTGKVNNVTTARTKAGVSDAVENEENAGNPQYTLHDQGIFDSECSRHMTGNKSFLTDYQEIDGGFVAFGGSPKGVKLLEKKNSVLFTKTECLVLSPDFKLLDESQATIDESNLWHRRLGHINFKTVNKLVRGNLVRGLPSKLFENDHTYVAFQKGKQHKALDKTLIFCGMKGIKREFSVARTPQQNGVAERKNRTLIEAARTMLNRVLVTKPHNKTPYELLHGRPPSISFMRPFGCHVTILNTLDPLGKFDGKADEGFLVGYSINSKAFRVFNTRTRKVEENLHITFLENKPNVAGSGPDWLFDIDLLTNSMNYEPVTAGNQTNGNAELIRDAVADDAGKKTTEEPTNNGYANSTNRVSTFSPSVSAVGQSFVNADDLSTDPLMPDLEDTTDLLNTGIFSGAYDDEDVGAEADINNLETTMNASPISTTRIHKDHLKDQIIRDINSATQTRRMTKISKEHSMDEEIRSILAYASFMGFIMYQMDVKSAFLYGTIEEEVYVCQPPGFEDLQFPNKVYKVEKALYGLHQAPRAELPAKVKQKDDGIFINQDKYVADLLKKFDFVTLKTTITPIETNKALLKDEEDEDVDVHLYRSIIGSLMYLTASRPDIMFAVCACARFQVTPNVSHLHAVKRIFRYLKGQPKLGLWYLRDSPFDLKVFYDSDYAGASLDRKSIIGGCQFLGKRLISWQCKKQTIVANSTTEAEYVAAANCCGQNPVFHSKTKHFEIRHHFIRDSYEKRLIQVIKIHIDHNVADLLIKAFDVSSDEFGVKTGSCKVNAARQDLVPLGEKSSVRSNLYFNDVDGVTSLTNSEILENLALMGYEIISDKLTFQKAFFSPQWKYLIHTILHCLSLKSTTWNEFSTNIASAVICLANNQKFNFSKLFFDEPFNDTYETPKHTQKVFANMRRKGKSFSGTVTSLFQSMLAIQAVEGEGSGQPSEPQPTPSPASPSHESSVPPKKVGDEAIYTREDDRVVRAATTATSLEAEQESGSGPRCQDTTLGDADAHTKFETASKQSHDPPLSKVNTSGSGEDSMEHQDDLTDFVAPTPYDSPLLGGHTPRSDEGRPNITELMTICTKLSNMVLALEHSKTAQDLVIKKLQKKVKRLEKTQRARTSRMKLFKIGTSRRKILDKENVSKQGRNLKTRPMFKEGDFDDDFDDIDDMVNESIENVKGDTVNASGVVNTATTGVSAASALVTTVGVSISIVELRTPPITTTTAFKD